MFLALFWPCFSPRTLYFVALRTLLRMSLIFQKSLPTPLSSQKCPPTPQINTQFGFFHAALHLNQSHSPRHYCRTPPTLPYPLLMDSRLHHLNWLHESDARAKEFIGRIYLDTRMHQRQYGCRVNQNHQHHHRQEHKQDNTQRITQTVIKLLPSIMNRIPGLACHDRNSSSSSSSSCFTLLSLEPPSDTEMTYPPPSVWDVHRHNTSA